MISHFPPAKISSEAMPMEEIRSGLSSLFSRPSYSRRLERQQCTRSVSKGGVFQKSWTVAVSYNPCPVLCPLCDLLVGRGRSQGEWDHVDHKTGRGWGWGTFIEIRVECRFPCLRLQIAKRARKAHRAMENRTDTCMRAATTCPRLCMNAPQMHLLVRKKKRKNTPNDTHTQTHETPHTHNHMFPMPIPGNWYWIGIGMGLV